MGITYYLMLNTGSALARFCGQPLHHNEQGSGATSLPRGGLLATLVKLIPGVTGIFVLASVSSLVCSDSTKACSPAAYILSCSILFRVLYVLYGAQLEYKTG